MEDDKIKFDCLVNTHFLSKLFKDIKKSIDYRKIWSLDVNRTVQPSGVLIERELKSKNDFKVYVHIYNRINGVIIYGSVIKGDTYKPLCISIFKGKFNDVAGWKKLMINNNVSKDVVDKIESGLNYLKKLGSV